VPDLERLDAYDYPLPPELIAHHPAERRDASRLMLLDRAEGTVRHGRFTDLVTRLRPGDALILNETRVVNAKLRGFRTATGGAWEGLFLRAEPDGRWVLIGQTRGRLQTGERVTLTPPDPASDARLNLVLLERREGGAWLVQPESDEPFLTLLDRFGTVPLPPYIERSGTLPEDIERYQTSYARNPGSVAAPTAGLHFTPELLEQIRRRGVEIGYVTLHVGMGTFRPVSAERLADHEMHSEWCELPAETADLIRRTKAAGGRVVAVGTTSVRTLESAALHCEDELRTWSGDTNLFIRPPFAFRVVNAMLTNFHLPKSTLIVLVCTFAGYDLTMQAYRSAVEERYRFFSYGDAMFIEGVG
jgi:S-adenosylmethionine:tRNA ribosyltransferase-isomerase